MSELLRNIFNACDPFAPAEKEQFVDCDTARGSVGLVAEVQRRLSLAESPSRMMFSGHIGCGKSSELHELKRKLEQDNPTPGSRRFFAVVVDVSEYLDDFDVTTTDILLAIVSELASCLRHRLDIELEDSYFNTILSHIRQYLISDLEINEGELHLGMVKLKVQRLKKDDQARGLVRNALASKVSGMLEEINTVFDKARQALNKGVGNRHFHDLVIILDNLEKIRRVNGHQEGDASFQELFINRYAQLTSMQAHFIYTVPLRLARSPLGPQLEQRYGPLVVLPMVKVFERGHRETPFKPGVEQLKEMIKRRLSGATLDEAFNAQALEFLLRYSGGNTRSLMTFVQNACAYSPGTPIPLSAAQRAIQQNVRTFSTSVPDGHWSKLAKLERSTDQRIPNGDPDYLVMLENLSVLEYINGGSQDIFAGSEPWYAVNPIVAELKRFKDEVLAR